jgi:hypothetical protein
VSKRLMTAGSMCSTKRSSWGRRERIRPVCEAESQYFASGDASICLNDAFVLQGKGPDKPFVAGANFLLSRCLKCTGSAEIAAVTCCDGSGVGL